jgi:pyruvate dehydrogenase E2 component (dihydrolipoamide acetyltransferase)
MGVTLSEVSGTGPHGRITELDVRNFTNVSPTGSVSNPPAKKVNGGVRVIPLQGLRRQIASSMTQALSIPHILDFKEIDATALLAFRAGLNAAGHELTVTPFLLKACIKALQNHSNFNARFDAAANEIHEFDDVHLGFATSTDDGLMVPVVKNAAALSILDLSEKLNSLAELARTRKATADQLTGGTFTVTNFGSFGTWLGTPVIRPPEVGIAGFGRVTEKVVVVDGKPAVRKILPIVVAADHRINDGAHLGAFATEIAELLLHPENLEN